MDEKYVTFETAKLLHEKGFEINTSNDYWKIGPDGHMYFMCSIGAYTSDRNDKDAFYRPKDSYPCPTQAQAMRWLRERHMLHIDPHLKAFYQERPKKVYYRWCPTVIALPSEVNDWGITRPKGATEDDFYYNCYKAYHDTYEDACEEAIKYAIKELLKE